MAPTSSDRARHDSYDSEVASSIKSLFDLTTRIDERVKLLFENSTKIEDKFGTIMEQQTELLQRVTAVESREGPDLKLMQRMSAQLEAKDEITTDVKKSVEGIEGRLRSVEIQLQSIDYISRGHQNRWDNLVNNAMKLLIAIAAAFIIWKSGWSNPPTPTPAAPTAPVTKGP